MNGFDYGNVFNYNHNNRNIPTDVASIINYLEQNKSNNVYSFTNFHLLNVNDQLNLIKLWLSTTLCSYIEKCNLDDLNNVHEILNNMNVNISNMATKTRKRLKKTSKERVSSAVCPKCNVTVTLPENVNFWESINMHKHFEEKLVSLIKSQNNAESCIIQIEEEPGISSVPLVRNYAPDINYNFRFNFNMGQYYTNMVYPVYVPIMMPFNHVNMQSISQPVVYGINPLTTLMQPNISKVKSKQLQQQQPQLLQQQQPLPLQQQKEQQQQEEKNDYCKSVKNMLYPKSIMKQHDNYMLQLRDGLCFCLMCTVSFESTKNTIMEHLYGRKHMKALDNKILVDSLNQYHTFWMEQTDDDQMEQQYFNPLSKNFIYCILCKRTLGFDLINDHLSSSQHILSNKDDKLDVTAIKRRAVLNNENEDFSDNSSTNSDNSSIIENNTTATKNVKHIVKESITTKKHIGFFDQLEFRFKSHLIFLAEKPQIILCRLCSKEMPKSIDSVKEHIIKFGHQNLSRVPLLRRKYFCAICDVQLLKERKWLNHFNSSLHKDNFDKLSDDLKKSATEYECSCGTVAFGKKEQILKHPQSSTEIRDISKYRLRKPIKDIIRSNTSLEKEIKLLVNESNELLNLKNNMWKCCKSIEDSVAEIFPLCKAYPFGSRVTGLGNKESDLDVFLDIGDMYSGNNLQDATSQKKILKKVKNVFFKKRNIFVDINAIATARTPIIQVVHLPTDIDFDISFKNGLSVENTEFLRLCISLEETTRPLILFLKKWLKIQRLNTNISTYALSMMVIFYLQTNNHLLPVHTLKTLNHKLKIIQDWEAIDLKITEDEIKKHIVPNNLSLKDSLISIFDFYASFNFATDVICPLLGKIVKKSDFMEPPDGSALPKEMETYVRKLERPSPEIFKVTAELCVQDPFDLSHNLTKACQQGNLTRFKSLCDTMTMELSKI